VPQAASRTPPPPRSTPRLPRTPPRRRNLVARPAISIAARPAPTKNLAVFANRNISSVWGQRAALALGYDDYSTSHAQQALAWLQKAKPDALLLEYTLFWTAQSERALGKNARCREGPGPNPQDFPGATFKEQVLEAYASAAVAAGHAQDALDMLATYAGTGSKPNLLLSRAHAEESARKFVPAAKDYQALFYKYPLADESKDAAVALPPPQQAAPHPNSPTPPAEMQDQRAQIFYDAHKWHEARLEYRKSLATILKDTANPIRQRALRSRRGMPQHPKAAPSLFVKLAVTDPEADAERLYDLSQAWRSDKRETEMLTAIEKIAEKYPQSRWSEDSLMAAGNYYLGGARIARKQGIITSACSTAFPGGRHAQNAEWRIAWIAYIQRQPFSDEKMINSCASIPRPAPPSTPSTGSAATPERNGNPARARAFYEKGHRSFPLHVFRAHPRISAFAKA